MIIKKEENDHGKEKLLFVGNVKTVRQDRFRLDGGEVLISDVIRADAGPYLCYYQDNEELKLRHFVEVQYPPTVHSITPLKQIISKGASVTLECTADGNPMPKIRWSKKKGPLPSGAETEEGLSMTLEDVDRHVEGRYTCTADNGVGKPASVTMSVEVNYPPEIISEKVSCACFEGLLFKNVVMGHSSIYVLTNQLLYFKGYLATIVRESLTIL